MAREKNKTKKAAQGILSEKQVKEKTEEITVLGDELSYALMDLFSKYGSSPIALGGETIALAKVWASLKVIGRKQGVDLEKLFTGMLPSFEQQVMELMESDVNE